VEDHLHLVSLAGDWRWLLRPTRLAKQLSSVSIYDLQIVPSASPVMLKAEFSEVHLDLSSSSRTDLVGFVLADRIVVGKVIRLDRPTLSSSSASTTTAAFTIRNEALDPRKESLHPCVHARGGVSASSAVTRYSNQGELAVLGYSEWTTTVSLASVCALGPGTQLDGGGSGAGGGSGDVAAAHLTRWAQHLDDALLQCALLWLLGFRSWRSPTNGASPP